MLGKLFGILTVFSFAFSAFSGDFVTLSSAIGEGAVSAVELSISLLGGMCFWSGVAGVLDGVGFTKIVERLFMPALKFVYPEAYKKRNGLGEVAQNISANFLGLGNAALPLGISAMKKFSENSDDKSGRASDDMIMFVVLATTPFQLLPTTLAILRQAQGSASPFEILLPVWICELATTLFAILVCRLLSGRGLWRRK